MLTDVVVVKLNLKNCLDASRFSAFDGGRFIISKGSLRVLIMVYVYGCLSVFVFLSVCL